MLLAARLALAAVFLVAGLTKFRDLEGSRRAVADFGVPRRLAWLLGTLLPLAELATAGALVPHLTARWGGAAALTLLLVFSGGIAFNLLRGRTPECRCFGQVHSTPVSWRLVARNLALAGGALAILVGAGALALGAGAALVAVFLLRRAQTSSEGLPSGTKAPHFDALPELLAARRPILLVFASQHCGPCAELAPELAAWQRKYADRLVVHELDREDSEEIFDAYRVDGTPMAILIGPAGRIASGVAPGEEAIRELVATVVDDSRREGKRVVRREFVVRVAGVGALAAVLLHEPRRAVAALSRRAERPCRPACGPQQDCDDGRCVCLDSDHPDECGRLCTNFIRDPANCGGCGNDCPPGKRCKCNKFELCAGRTCLNREGDGSCSDPCTKPGTICCDEECVDPQSSLKHCGGCGKPPCKGKKPRCCFGICRDIATDPKYCGGCREPDRNICKPPTPLCHAGKCRKECPKPLKRCGNTCFAPKYEVCCKGRRVISKEDLRFDDENCNECERKCGDAFRPGQLGGAAATCGGACCSGKCTDTCSDNCNCNGCGKRCKKNEICRGRDGCVCPLGQTCKGEARC